MLLPHLEWQGMPVSWSPWWILHDQDILFLLTVCNQQDFKYIHKQYQFCYMYYHFSFNFLSNGRKCLLLFSISLFISICFFSLSSIFDSSFYFYIRLICLFLYDFCPFSFLTSVNQVWQPYPEFRWWCRFGPYIHPSPRRLLPAPRTAPPREPRPQRSGPHTCGPPHTSPSAGRYHLYKTRQVSSVKW